MNLEGNNHGNKPKTRNEKAYTQKQCKFSSWFTKKKQCIMNYKTLPDPILKSENLKLLYWKNFPKYFNVEKMILVQKVKNFNNL